MKKQKHGFWLFIFSLIPGAGEMYMGFRKQGISIMTLFWGLTALASISGMDWLIMFLPIVWFYSFFNVHNLKSLSEDEFYSVEDDYILHLDNYSGNLGDILKKHQNVAAGFLILLGACLFWGKFMDIIYILLPDRINYIVITVFRGFPQLVFSALIIAAGIYILTIQKKRFQQDNKPEDEHYWEPYRPYQQNSTESTQEPKTSGLATLDLPEEPDAIAPPAAPDEPQPSSDQPTSQN